MSTHRDDKCVSSGSSWTVYMLTFINAGSLNFRFHKSWWPLSVCSGSRESRPAQADWINQLNEAAMEIQTSWLIFLKRYHDVFSRYWNTRWNVAPECVGVSSGEDRRAARDLFWKHAYVTLLYRLLCLSDLCCKQSKQHPSAGSECQWCQASIRGGGGLWAVELRVCVCLGSCWRVL